LSIYVYSNESAIVLLDSTNVGQSVAQQWQYCKASGTATQFMSVHYAS